MSDDFEPLVTDMKMLVYRANANGLRFVNYLNIDHHLNNINYFDLINMLLCYEAGYIIQV